VSLLQLFINVKWQILQLIFNSQDKSSELAAIAGKENSVLKLKITAIASRATTNSSDIFKKLEGIRKTYHDRVQQIMKRAKVNIHKFYSSMSSVKEKNSVQRLQTLRQQGKSLMQRKFNAASQRIKSIREWQAAEVT
jgi:hypothetical protein